MKQIKYILICLVIFDCSSPKMSFESNKGKFVNCIAILDNYDGIGVLIPHEPDIDHTNPKSIDKEVSDYYGGLTLKDFQDLMKLMSELKIIEINDIGETIHFSITKSKGYAYSQKTELISNEYIKYEKLEQFWFYWKNIK